MGKDGLITRKHIIEDQALTVGIDYAKNMQPAIEAHKELLASAKAMAPFINMLRNVGNEKEYISLKEKANLKTLEAINANKLLEASEISLERIKQSKLKTEKEALTVQAKIEAAKRTNTKLTIEERAVLAETTAEIKKQTIANGALASAYKKLSAQQSIAGDKVKNIISTGKLATESQTQYNIRLKQAQNEFEKLNTKVRSADAAVGQFNRNVGNYPQQAVVGIKNLIGAFGVTTGIYLFGSIMKDAFNVTRDFEREIVNLAAVAGKSRAEIKPLEDKIREVSKASINGATDVAKLASELIKLGSTTEEAERLLKPVNDLSVALKATAEDSATLVKSILNSYNLGAEEAGRVTDVLAEAANKSALDFQGLRDSFSYLAPAAKALGIPIEKTASIIGILADNGIRAESAGRLTSTAFARLANQGLTLEDALKKINTAQKDGSSNLEVLALASNLFGAEAGKIGLILANNTVKIEENTTAYENSKGSLEELTNKQLKSLDAELKILSSAWEDYILETNEASGASSGLSLAVSFLSSNLKTIFNVLGYLAAAWLAYKAALILANVQTKILALTTTVANVAQAESVVVTGFSTAAQTANAVATTAATTAWQRLNLALKANALGLIVAALVAAIYYLNKFKTSMAESVKSTIDSTKSFIENKEAVIKNNQAVKTLSDRHDELKSKTKLSKEEQKELNEIIKTLAKTVPGAVTQVDKYGDALSISTIKTREFVKANEELTKLQNTQKLIENKEALKDLTKEQNRLKLSRDENNKTLIEGVGYVVNQNGVLKKTTGIFGKLIALTLEEQIIFKQKVKDNEQNLAITNQNIRDLSGLTAAEKVAAKAADAASKVKQAAGARTIAIIDEEIKAQNELVAGLSDKTGKEGRVIKNKIAALNKERDLIFNNDKSQGKEAERSDKEKLDRAKRISDSIYELKKQQLEREVKISEDIVKDSEKSDDVRLEALAVSQEKQIALVELSKQYLLDADKFQLTNDRLNANEKTRIVQDAENKIIDINQKTNEEIDKINEFDTKSYEDNIKRSLSILEIANNEQITAEEKRYQAELQLGYKNNKAKEKAAEKHERILFDIKKEGLMAQTRLQIDSLAAEIDAYEKQSDGSQKSQDFILEKRREVAKLTTQLTQTEGESFKSNEKGKEDSVLTTSEKILQISSDTLGQLNELANAFSEAKIQKIDDEISKNNEYYDKQIELAGNDERQKDALQKERDKKNEELEKKKRAAQHKQAVYDKAVSIAQIAIATALAIIKAAPNPLTMSLAAVAGAISLATAIATPIPKYKMGRKGGPAEFAEVGDGGVHEVISRPDGSGARITPNKPTLTFLQQDDVVHKSMADFNQYKRNTIIKGFYKEKELAGSFQMNNNQNSNTELLEELRRTTEAIKKQKTNVQINNTIDLGHELWKLNNTNWRG